MNAPLRIAPLSRRTAPFALFFFSGASGLVYEVVWVRSFGSVFGNTVHSAALVTAVFMCGLGAGSYLAGAWADRRDPGGARSLLFAYGASELAIAALGALLAVVLPRLGAVSTSLSSYTRGAHGWSQLSLGSEIARYAFAALLLAPITLLMGGTLTLLVRYVVAGELDRAGVRIGALYGLNTAGAALGCFLTDFALVPRYGLLRTQLLSAGVDVAVGAIAVVLAGKAVAGAATDGADATAEPAVSRPPDASHAVVLTAIAVALTGFAAMGMEIVWLRVLLGSLGGYRAVFSLLLTVILAGTWVGASSGGWLHRRFGRAAMILAIAQGLFVVATLASLAAFDRGDVDRFLESALRAHASDGGLSLTAEVWPMLRAVAELVALPALVMGCSFPLANAIVQEAEERVGRRAGALYLANTLGAVLGALLVGFVLLPGLGAQNAVLACLVAAGTAVVPLALSTRRASSDTRSLGAADLTFAGVALALAIGLSAWGMLLPDDYLRARCLPDPLGDRFLTVSEGPNELLAVSVAPNGERRLWTNGHSMSVTTAGGQRYMRAFAHVPLLAMDAPKSVLVICFGVGNTIHAASLHPSVERIDLANLSRNVLEHGDWFAAANGGVLADPRVHVFVNDGRQHLRMQPPGSYDLVTLEPPPIAHAGVAGLYSKEFYELARSRLAPHGFLTQWLPIDQLEARESLALVRAFVDVFPNAILLSGERHDLILIGSPSGSVELDPAAVLRRLGTRPRVVEDLGKVQLGRLSELIGTFAADSETLRRATEGAAPVTDDAPSMEYSHASKVFAARIPRELFDVKGILRFCPACGPRAEPGLEDLDAHLRVLGRLYESDAFLRVRSYAVVPDELTVPELLAREPDVGPAILRSGYLETVVGIDPHGLPVSATDAELAALRAFQAAHPDDAVALLRLGLAELAAGRAAAARSVLARAVETAKTSATARFALALATARSGDVPGAIVEYRRALALAPDDVVGHLGLFDALVAAGQSAEAGGELRRVLALDPENGPAHKAICVALVGAGALDKAKPECARALASGASLDPTIRASVFDR